MKFVNLIVGQKRNLMSNLDSISKCQHGKFENINFFIFWDDDPLIESEKLFLKKKFKNTYFHLVNNKSFELKIQKIVNKNKVISKKMKKEIIRTFLQFSLLKYAFNFAVKKLKNTKYKKFIWQRMRSDIYVQDKIEKSIIRNKLYLPGTVHGYGFIDFHAIGTYEEFKVYSKVIDTLVGLYKINIFIPPEIVLRMHLTKFRVNCILSEKLPAALLENAKKQKLRHYFTSRGRKYLTNSFSNNIIEEDFKFMNNFILRKVYYYIYNIIIQIKLKIRD